MASPNPTGLRTSDRIAKRSLALTLRDMVSDEDIAEALIAIALEGRWPTRVVYSGKVGRPGHAKTEVHPAAAGLAAMSSAPDGAHRMMALKFLLERRDGMPMQAVLLKAEIDARHRTLENAGDVLDIDQLDHEAAGILERSLLRALGAGPTKPTLPIIDASSTDEEPTE